MREYVHSFAEFAKRRGIRVKSSKTKPVTHTCEKCGGQMKQIGNTNVFKCTGFITKTDEKTGKESKYPCRCTTIF